MHKMTRRTLVKAMATAAGAPLTSLPLIGGARGSAAAEQAPKPDITVEQWMNAWIGAQKEPGGVLHLSRFKDPMYFLTKPISWKPNPGEGAYPEVHVPKGFVTDFASIPQVFWSLLRPDGEYTYPAIIHDYLYWTQPVTRDKADEIFRLAMGDFQIGSATAFTIYHAVQWAGESAWKGDAAAKARGEKRILKRFPEDPRITWAQWQKDPTVFAD